MEQNTKASLIFSFIFGRVSEEEFTALSKVKQVRLFYQSMCTVLLFIAVVETLILAHITAINFPLPLF
jgi:hypothetical protein